MTRRLLIAANWKMNPAPTGAFDSASPYHAHSAADVWVFPSALDIPAAVHAGLVTGAQCASSEADGARTGDLSMSMLAAAKCRAVLCGHSERRHFHKETNAHIAAQAVAALEAKLEPIICIGETQSQREHGKEKEIIAEQMADLPLESTIILAYEPVWAIGTGKTATPDQAQEMHAYIRSLLPKDMRDSTRILYGGSVKPLNAKDLLSQKDIDGALIGGASLVPADFAEIVQTAIDLSA